MYLFKISLNYINTCPYMVVQGVQDVGTDTESTFEPK